MTKTKGLFLAVAFASISFISCGEEEVVFCNIPSKNTCEQKTNKECMSLVNNGLAQIVSNCDAVQEQESEFEKESKNPGKKVANKITEKTKEQAQTAAAQKVADSIAKHLDSLSKLQTKVGDFFAFGSRHTSIVKSKGLTLIAKSSLGGHLILDYMGNDKYRLATWNSKQKMSDKPSLSINGFKSASHNQGGISYDYKDKDGEVSIMGSIMSPNGWSIEFKLKGVTPEETEITPLYYVDVGEDEDWYTN